MSIEAMKQAVQFLKKYDDFDADEIIKALSQAIEQAEKQEPVAWHEPEAYGNVTTHKDWALANGWQPLYTAPPQREWVSLTKDEIIYEWELCRASIPRYFGFARGIDAKLKEKNHDY